MALCIGDLAPNFEADTTQGRINFHAFIGDSWVFFFSHPADFTPVCTTEMGRTAQLADAFEHRGCKPLGLSTDTIIDHKQWIDDVNDTQNVTLRFPIVSDKDLTVAQLYGMIHPGESQTAAVRSVFLIDQNKKIRLTMTYPMAIGRNFDEILRALDALQYGDAHTIATPADWRPGDRVIIPPAISDEQAKGLFPQGWDAERPYLRYTTVR